VTAPGSGAGGGAGGGSGGGASGGSSGASGGPSVFGRFAPRLQEAIGGRLGWTSLRPVQEEAGRAILDGKNAVVLAPTAGGKTEAAMFPAISLLLQHATEGVGAIYLAPIKALLNNQLDRLGLYTEMVGLRRFLWHGDVTAPERRAFVADPTELLMTTPESLEVMLASSKVPVPRLFADLRIVIVDEIHAMAGTDRGAHLLSVLERIADHSRHDVQRVGLSATVGNPAAILAWLRGTSRREGIVVDPPKAPRPRDLAVTLEADPFLLAGQAAGLAAGKKSLFFCESRALTEVIAERMRGRGTDVFVHHSSVSLAERCLAEEKFHSGGSAAIVCTSTLELGIDVGDLDLVFQANAPSTVSSFLQRMGRTGRREGKHANTTFFCDSVDAVAQAVALIELARTGWVESIPPQERCWPVFVHQLLAFTLEAGGIPRGEAWRKLSRLPDLAGISRAEFDAVVDHMVATDSLFEAGGQLSMGETAERTYGKKNFLELYAVFSSPLFYRVMTVGGAEIGSLDQGFVDSLVEAMTSFLLGGRAWLVEAIDHKQRIVTATPAPRGKKPAWGGFAPRLLSFALSQQIKQLLSEEKSFGYLSEPAALALAQYREELAGVLGPEGSALQGDAKSWRWWTFAGGAINQTLRHAIAVLTGWKVVADSFRLRFEGEQLTETAVREVIVKLSSPALWEDLPFWLRVVAQVPPYRLSKFQPALPPRYQLELIGNTLLDLPGTRTFLSASGAASASASGAAAGAPALPLLRRVVAELPAAVPVATPMARPTREIRWIEDSAALRDLCAELKTRASVALDVETTLFEHDLCLVQLGVAEYSALIDARAIDDLSPLLEVLEAPSICKVIHNAAFELGVFGQRNMGLRNVVDTLALSRRIRGRQPEGHSLAAVCRRELGLRLDKTAQTSDWTQRPLTQAQLDYAALDVEILSMIHDRLVAADPQGKLDT
jgi:ATP-dependent helicase Lhr and Lhr-like helicase